MTGIAEMLARAWKHQQAGGFSQAEQIYRQILHEDPTQADAWCFLGTVCQAQGRLAEAGTHYRRATELWPGHRIAHNGLAIILAETGKLDEAAAAFLQLLQWTPTDADAHNNLGLVRGRQGQLDEAIACFRQALQLRSDYASARGNLQQALEHKRAQAQRLAAQVVQSGGNLAATSAALNQRAAALIQQGQFDQAKILLQQALQLEPNNADAQINLANVFVRLEKYDEAIVQYQLALQSQPDHFGAHYILGIALHDKGRLIEAEAHYREAVRLNPNFADTYNSLGLTLMQQGRVDEAVACYHRALHLKPNFLQACNNLGAALGQQDKLDDAINCYRHALRLDPHCAEACNNLGMVLKLKGEFDAALTCFEDTLRLEPRFASAHWNRSVIWLLRGDFERGWPEYEFRWDQPDFGKRHFVQLLWDGSDLGGKTILIYAEQGLGDTLQFVRYIPLVQQRGGRVIFQCQPPLLRLLANFPGVERLLTQESPLSAFDVHAPLLSLPGIFRTSLTTVPSAVPYLQADPELMQGWKAELATVEGFKVGIAWQGNPAFRDDRQRSIRLARFARLARVPGVRLINLQKGPGTDQLQEIEGQFPVLDFGSRLDDVAGPFMDTAAIIKSLDLVICSDTAVAHLAGALAVPVWVALPLVPDWRWLLEGEDCPWYPTMRLFRQTRHGDWESVFDRIAEELQALVASLAS
jgi:tetratricopeptide (TPR) repeat protein